MYYTQSTVCQRGFYERISSNNFLVVVHGRMQDLPRGQLFGGLSELHGVKWLVTRGVAKRLLGGSGACYPEKKFLNGVIWCVL